MKRIYLWLRELSLTQQLVAIVILVIGVFAVFLSTFLTPSIQSFIDVEMNRMLHYSHESSVYYMNQNPDLVLFSNRITGQEGITQGIYFADSDTFRMFDDTEISAQDEQKLREHLSEAGGKTRDYQFRSSELGARNDRVLYCMTKLKTGDVLYSIMPAAYEEQFRALLINDVVNANIIVVAALFMILLVWVASLIHPLNQIKNYISGIKNDDTVVLNLNRRDEIGEVADALRDMQEELKKQNHEKQEMIQNISHDLKTPIATIRSYGESIKDGIYPYGTLEKSIDVIIEHAGRLEKKVKSLIALNKMDYLLDDCPPGNTLVMSNVIEKVLLSLRVIRPEITFERDIDTSVCFQGDEDPWRIVVENLTDNALRYARSTIWIQLSHECLIIGNDGKSIDNETLKKMFRPYEKGTDGQFGLGLSIVYRVVTTYGYKVEAANLKEGVQFKIWRDISKKEKRALEKSRNKDMKRKEGEKKDA